MRHLLVSATVIALAGSAFAQDAMKMTMVTPDALTWKDNPALPKGSQVAILLGDPTKTGEMVIQRIRLPANYQIPPHTHPYAEIATVISGNVGFGDGEKFEEKGEMVKAGTFRVTPAKHAHYVWTGNEPVILQTQFIGPSKIDYINPADDPRKQ